MATHYPVKLPTWLHQLPGIYRPAQLGNTGVFLTFDDGPHPHITPIILDLLQQYRAKATFFCLGSQAEAYPEIVQRIMQDGHTVGNHSFNHPNGLKTKTRDYLDDVERAAQFSSHILFRPPYGQISPRQLLLLRKQGFRTVLWDVMPGDFDPSVSPEECLGRTLQHLAPGIVYVFHDSEKAASTLMYVLPRLLEAMKARNLVAESIRV